MQNDYKEQKFEKTDWFRMASLVKLLQLDKRLDTWIILIWKKEEENLDCRFFFR